MRRTIVSAVLGVAGVGVGTALWVFGGTQLAAHTPGWDVTPDWVLIIGGATLLVAGISAVIVSALRKKISTRTDTGNGEGSSTLPL
jgi:hypothetical protein